MNKETSNFYSFLCRIYQTKNQQLTCGHGILRFLRFIFFRGERELELLDELLVEPVDTEEDERSRF